MIIRVHIQDPDAFSQAIDEAIEQSFADTELDSDEKDALLDLRREKAEKALEKWVEYVEYVTLEFDTVALTAKVVEKE
jgi:hypothetical protein